MKAPSYQLCSNSGWEPATVTRSLRKEKNQKFGYDLVNDEFCDMVKVGIIDATKVARMAIENALSVSTLLLSSDTLVSTIPKEEEEEEGHHHHHDEDGMGGF